MKIAYWITTVLIALLMGVSGIPALILFRNGKVVDRKAGLMAANQLASWVKDQTAAAS